MSKLQNKHETPEIDRALSRMEDGDLGQALRVGLAGQEIPPLAAQHLQSRLYSATTAHAARTPRLSLGVMRLAGGLALVALIVAALAFATSSHTPVASASELLQKAEKQTSSTVDPGKVRHIVREATDTGTTDRPGYDTITEIWMMQGPTHLLTRWEIHDRQGTSTEFTTSLLQVVDESYSWNSDPSTNTVYKAPFDSCVFDFGQWLGDKDALKSWSENTGAKVVGTEMINGVQAQIIDIDSTRLWVNPDSGLILRMTKSETGTDGVLYSATDQLVSDDTIDAQSAPADLFDFTPPAGSKLNVMDTPMCSRG